MMASPTLAIVSERRELLDREVGTGHADTHRTLVDLALDLGLHAVLRVGHRPDELILVTAVGVEHPVSTLEVAPADRALELHVQTIACDGRIGQCAGPSSCWSSRER